jgi:hypothetical protein
MKENEGEKEGNGEDGEEIKIMRLLKRREETVEGRTRDRGHTS